MKQKRKRIRHYFIRFNIKWFLFWLLLTMAYPLIGGIPLIFYIARYALLKSKACSDREFDKTLENNIQNLQQLVGQKMNIEEADVLNRFEILAHQYTPKRTLWGNFVPRGLQIPFELRKKGKDGLYRHTPLIFQLLLCLDDKLVVCITKLDLLTGNLIDTFVYNVYFNEITTYYFQDITEKMIVSLSLIKWIKRLFGIKTEAEKIEEKFPSIVQGNIKEVNLSRAFIIETRGGTNIELALPDQLFIENLEDTVPYLSEASDTIFAVQTLLDNKKITTS